MARVARWIIGTPSWTLAGLSCTTLGAVVGGGLYARQYLLKDHQVCRAATEQLEGAAAVRRMLGGSDVSRVGPVGGYVDPKAGTAVLTMTLATASGARCGARVEAEVDGDGEPLHGAAEAAARANEGGAQEATDGAKEGGESTRWLLRHLEVTPGDPGAPARGPTEVLYSVPARLPLGPYAPSREPTGTPDWLRKLLPEPAGIMSSPEGQRLLIASSFGVAINVLFLTLFRQRARVVIATKSAMDRLALPSDPALVQLRDAALVEAARSEPGIRLASDALYGAYSTGAVDATQGEMALYLALEGQDPRYGRLQKDGFVRAVRQSEGGRWQVAHVSLHSPRKKEALLGQAADSEEGARSAFRELVREAEAASDLLRQQEREEKYAPGARAQRPPK